MSKSCSETRSISLPALPRARRPRSCRRRWPHSEDGPGDLGHHPARRRVLDAAPRNRRLLARPSRVWVEDGETFAEAAAGELREETGLEAPVVDVRMPQGYRV